MALPTLSDLVLLTFGGNIPAQMCAQAASAGVRSLILLQSIDETGNNTLQQWQFGDDGRIYLYTPDAPASLCLTFAGEPELGEPLALATPDPTDQTQVWQWINNYIGLQNVGASQSGTTFVMDNNTGSTQPGNKIQIWAFNTNSPQFWIPESVSVLQIAQTPAQATAA